MESHWRFENWKGNDESGYAYADTSIATASVFLSDGRWRAEVAFKSVDHRAEGSHRKGGLSSLDAAKAYCQQYLSLTRAMMGTVE